MQGFHEKAIIERVRLLRNQYAGNRGKSKFARALGISASTYSYYENNRVPPIEILLKIYEVTGADLDWLLTGRETPKAPISEMRGVSFGQNSSLLRKLDVLLGENPDLAEPILAFIELLCEKKGVEKEFYSKVAPAQMFSAKIPPPKPARPGWIPVLGRTAAGMVHFWGQTSLPEPRQAVTELDELVKKHIGKAIIGSVDGMLSIDLQVRVLVDGLKGKQANLIQVSGQEAEQIVEFVQCEEIHKLFPDSFALQVDGDSMSPRINDGDIVILSPSVPAAQGQIGIARVANQIGVTCKLIRTTETAVHLIPINERYETKVVAKKDLLWALAVLCHISA
jgi:transcriptional regulator with XRE-family HTH domain